MTLDAMDWVWTHSQTRGNARLVLLAVANGTTDATATVRMGTTEMARHLNAARSTTITAIDSALDSGELVQVEPAVGSRAALYLIPGAVNYDRYDRTATGPEFGPVAPNGRGSETRTPNRYRSGIRTPTRPDSGPPQDDSEPGYRSEFRTPTGPDSGPHHPPIERVSEGGSDARPREPGVPDFARPLVDSLTAAGVVVRWSLTDTEWLTLDALIRRSGADMLAAHAADAASRRHISHARYFLRAWRDLPPMPNPNTTPATPATPPPARNVIPLNDRRRGGPASGTAPPMGRAAQAAQWYAGILAEENET